MPIATTNGIRLHYQRTGQGPDLVLIHGFLSNLALWQLSILPGLAKDFRVTRYDLRGHGYSEMPQHGYTADYMAADLHGLLDYLDIKKAILVGHSYGGVVALHYALLHPERAVKLIIADAGLPAAESWGERRPVLAAWRDGLQRAGVDVLEDRGEEIEYLLEQTLKLRERFRSGIRTQRNYERLLRLIKTTSMSEEYQGYLVPTPEMIGRIKHPVLLSYGQHSPCLASFRFLRSHLPNCETAYVESAGHFHPFERPELFLSNAWVFLGV